MLRQCTPSRLVCWVVVSEPVRLRVRVQAETGAPREQVLLPGEPGYRLLSAGTHLHYALIDLPFAPCLPKDVWIGYTLALQPLATFIAGLASPVGDICCLPATKEPA